MKEIRLKYLYLFNFKGIKSFEVAEFKNGILIFGDNKTGKTTIFDGFSWLLFGKDSLNNAAFDIKPLDEKGEALHGLEYGVQAILSTNNGDIELKKVYYEKYTKRRGETKRTFTGHTVDHFVDTVPKKQKEFNAAVNNLCTEDVFKLLTNPRHFNEVLHWTDRRTLLFKICGDVPDKDVIAAHPALSSLPDILGTHSLADHKKIIKGTQTEINKNLDKIPIQIAESTSSKIEVAGDVDVILRKIDEYKTIKSTKEQELAALKSGGGIAEKEKELAELEAKIQVHKNEVSKKEYERLADQRTELSDLESVAVEAGTKTEKAVILQTEKMKEKKRLAKKMPSLITERDALRKEWHAKDAEKFVPVAGPDLCPACGEKIPAHKIEAATKLAEEGFNQVKAKALTGIQTRGKTLANQITELESDQKEVDENLAGMDADIQGLAELQDITERVVDECKARHEQVNLTIPPDLHLDEMTNQVNMIQLDINGLRAGTYEQVMAVENEIQRVENYIDLLNKDELQIKANLRVDNRVIELQQQERTLAAEFEGLESEMALIEDFIRAKTAMLNKKISAKFKLASFRLFVENINGGLEETCDTTIDGVPYSSMNNASRINVGLDICNTLSEYHGISLPCFIDNSEAVTRLVDTSAQQIRLVVSEPDKSLRIEKL